MQESLEAAVDVVANDVRQTVERVWREVVQNAPPEYRLLIWGSCVQDKARDPADVDVIIAYAGDPLDPGEEKSIEGWLTDAVDTEQFDCVDPLVTHQDDVAGIVANSRVGGVYCVGAGEWVDY